MKILEGKYILEIRFRAQPQIFDKRGRIAKEIHGFYDRWEIRSDTVSFTSLDSDAIKCKISLKDVLIIVNYPEDEKSFKDQCTQFLDLIWKYVPSNEITRVGIRTLLHYYTKESISPQEFQQKFQKNLNFKDNEIVDIGIAYDLKLGEEQYSHIAFGPARDDQIHALFGNEVEFKDGLFLDYDFFRLNWEKKVKVSNVQEFVKEALASKKQIIKSIDDGLKDGN